MAERRMKLRLGLFVAGSLIVLSGLVVLFGRLPNLLSDKTRYTVVTPASGVIAAAQQSLDRIGRSFEKLEKAGPKLEQASDEIALLARDIRQFLPELRETNKRLQKLIGDDPIPPGEGPISFQPGAQP